MEFKLRAYQLKLIQQVYQSFADGYKKPLVVLPTGGGKTAIFAWMASKTQNKGNTVWFLVHRKELLDQTVETFNKFDVPRKTINIAMVSQWRKLPKPDLIVLDEAHHSSARTWKSIFKAYPNTYTIGLTATPARLDGKPLGELYDSMIQGPSTQELINRGYLSDYKSFVAEVGLGSLKVVRGDFDQKEAEKQLRSSAVYGKVVETYMDKVYGKQAIYFCTTIEHSVETARRFREAGINAKHFDGNTPKKERTKIVEKFRSGEIEVLCNVSLIGEGFDMPTCDVVGMLRPTMSLSVYLQQAGRCLRPAKNKTAAILDHVGNIQRHGFPSDPREWSLDFKVKQARPTNNDGSYVTRSCPECYAVYESKEKNCPVCGREYFPEPRELSHMENVRMVQLKRLKESEEQKYWSSVEALREAKSYSDYCKIAKARGYKVGWAYHQAKQRGVWVPY